MATKKNDAMATYNMPMPSHPAKGPARAGAVMVVTLMTRALRAAAFMMRCRGTTCGTTACRAGIMKGMMQPWAKAAMAR